MTNQIGGMYGIAKIFSELGYSVIPCDYRTKAASVKWTQYQEQRPTDHQIFKWFAHRITNAAVLTGCHGYGVGLVVIDFDNLQDFETWKLWASQNNPVTLDAYMVKTRRGMHVYLSSVNEHSFRNLHYEGVDVKGAGGYVMLPGSIHPSGFVYESVDSDNLFIPGFESIEEVLPPEILERRKNAIFESYDRPPTMELSDSQILDIPAGRKLTIEQIKARHRIEDFIPVAMVTGADYYVAHCPFHNDENPSFWVNTAKQICGCQAGCTPIVLDVVNLFARLHNVSNSEAINQLSNI